MRQLGRPPTTNAFSAEKFYWGEGGQWGPYSAEPSGRPNAAEVLHLAMQQAHLTIAEVTRRYNLEMKRLNKHAISLNRMYRMTRDYTQVPEDITRREVLAHVFQVSPVLLGLAAREQMVLSANKHAPSPPAAPPVLTRAPLLEADVLRYEQHIRLLWLVYHTDSARTILADVQTAVQELERLRQQVSGSLLERIQSLLYQHYRLAAATSRDQGQYQQAYDAASQAITVAKQLENREWLAPALYTRGHICLVWGMLGEKTSQGLVTLDYTKVLSAIKDLEDALTCACRPQLQGLIIARLSRAQAFFAVQGGKVVHPTLVTLAKSRVKTAQDFTGRSSNDEPYMQWLLDADLAGNYLLDKAVTYNLIGLSEQAEEMLDDELEQAIPRHLTRQTAWMQIVRADVALKQRDFFTATSMATNAFLACRDIHSVGNLAIINDLHSQLLKVKSARVDEQSVYDLGAMLTRYYQSSARIL